MATYIKNKTTGNWERSGWNGVLSFGFTGCVVPFAGTAEKVPAHWLVCDGSAVGRTEYPDLFDCIGETYGAGDGSTTFNLPDFRECTLVGAGQSTRAILDNTGHSHDVYSVGEFKDDQIQGHGHALNGNGGGVDYGRSVAGFNRGSDYNGTSEQYPSATYPIDIGYSTPRIGTTTHGKQLGVNYIIHI